ncbi:anti-sigma factor [Pseudonocardia sp. KRD-184]|uniref:Anti-sigma factor n=1 Tax=Pseudonocardia oceani TaxID=2792013 RepID=A0ABS6UGK0_9PSEU|nr:anti-sigma factor [Pseudonocardia oceani]MBW0090287.1 anti-sigma factor [Pseudonocardia oceani]MBW0100261.1 anti-sigma factor [Pseudonocardia oceani]MBW0109932.1 anti-sigma factor [Pseudonocardia oceani]MBW0120375.1 anti-sigma factor [Pseudonocardia oceani]MBW0131371.1 anti-sigma factor [Pseudonocardia oceani]
MRHPHPDRLALAALPSHSVDAQVERHLAGCALCRAHVEELRRTVDLATSGGAAADDEPPPDRIWTAITGELGHGPRPRRWAPPVAAALVALLVGFAAGRLVGDEPPAGRPLAVLAAVDGTGATGSASLVDREGVRAVVVHVEGVVAAPEDDYLEVWLTDGSGVRMFSLGALARDGGGYDGEFTVPSDLPMERFPTLEVSAERFDGVAAHSRDSLLRGAVH